MPNHGAMFGQYLTALDTMCTKVPGLRDRLVELEEDAQRLAGTEPKKAFLHTRHLLEELAEKREWNLLMEQAERHLDSDDLSLATQSTKMYALSLAQIGGSANCARAIGYYRQLVTSNRGDFDDLHTLAVLLTNVDQFEEAVRIIFSGIESFPSQMSAFL